MIDREYRAKLLRRALFFALLMIVTTAMACYVIVCSTVWDYFFAGMVSALNLFAIAKLMVTIKELMTWW